LRKLRQEDHKFNNSLGYKDPVFKKKSRYRKLYLFWLRCLAFHYVLGIILKKRHKCVL
jgi:hypothetical protein